jgi:hypothetical protein
MKPTLSYRGCYFDIQIREREIATKERTREQIEGLR